MMKRNILAVIVPALLVAGTANAAEIYNKDGNKVDLYGKAVGLHYFSKGNGEDSYGGNGDMTYARLGFKGETQINSDLTGPLTVPTCRKSLPLAKAKKLNSGLLV